MAPDDWAYFVGIIDGEGCIHIGQARRWHSLRLTVSQSDWTLMRWIQSRFEGNIKIAKGVQYRRTHYVWYVGPRAAREILEGVLPYLVVKKGQAILALEFCRLIGIQGSPINNYDERESFKQKMHVLNQGRDE